MTAAQEDRAVWPETLSHAVARAAQQYRGHLDTRAAFETVQRIALCRYRAEPDFAGWVVTDTWTGQPTAHVFDVTGQTAAEQVATGLNGENEGRVRADMWVELAGVRT